MTLLRPVLLIAPAIFSASIFIPAVQARAEGLRSCSVGQRVKAPGGPATVVATSGSGCTVRIDGRPYTDVYAAFMLESLGPPPAPVVRAPGGVPKPGNYQCFGGPAGNMKLRFLGGNAYANEQGKRGTFVAGKNGQIKFVSGPWEGFFAKALANGRVGLTSVDGGSFYNMTCDPR